ncbi:MAG TPA: HTH domain-containing protein [Bacteroidetes bacterium]|nr:HTH domain-containing protein [Bacteroidota bacterium]
MNQQQRELVERIGVINEKLGLQPVAARVNALLLVSEKNRLTFDEIQEELQVSKSSVSNAINLLLSTGQIDYITLPGERKRYFRTNIEKWPRLIERLMDFAVMYRNLFREMMEMRHDKDPDFIRSVEGLIDFINRLLEEVPRMLNEYNQNRN